MKEWLIKLLVMIFWPVIILFVVGFMIIVWPFIIFARIEQDDNGKTNVKICSRDKANEII